MALLSLLQKPAEPGKSGKDHKSLPEGIIPGMLNSDAGTGHALFPHNHVSLFLGRSCYGHQEYDYSN